MKKSLIVTLALVFVLGIAGTAFAANPFVDVPAKHWSYDAVAKLAQAGIVDGYGDGTFKGDKTMTRYEMATVVAKAMAKSDKADAEQKAAIDKLAAEFSAELANLGVKVAALEKKAAADTVNIKGEARIRYENKTFDTAQSNSDWNLRTRLHLTGNINDQWTYAGHVEAVNNLQGTGDSTASFYNATVQGPVLGATATIGRFDYIPNYGLMIDSTMNGVNFAFGNVVKTNVFYGKEQNVLYGATNAAGDAYKPQVAGVNFGYAVAKDINLTGGYYYFKNNEGLFDTAYGTNVDTAKVWELGFDTKLSPEFVFKAAYGKSDANTDNKAYFAQIDYKGTDISKVGSFGAWVNYRKLEANAAPKTTFDNDYANAVRANGGKGYEVGFGYVPMANTLFKAKYVEVKSTTSGAAELKTKYFQTQMEFFF